MGRGFRATVAERRWHQGVSCPFPRGCLDRGIPSQIGATLLHKDPEFRAIAGLPQEWLG
jgi:hypothetical protein